MEIADFITRQMLRGQWCSVDDYLPDMASLILDFANTLNRPDGVWRHYADQHDIYLTQVIPLIQWP